MIVRLIEGAEDGPIIYDLKMPAAPHVGDTVTLRLRDRTSLRYRIDAVNYVVDVPKDGAEISEDLKIVQLVVTEV